MYDIKVYEDGREETIRGLSLPQASIVQSVFDRHGIRHTVKRVEQSVQSDGADWSRQDAEAAEQERRDQQNDNPF